MSLSTGPIFMSGAGHVPHGPGMTTKIIYFMVNGKLEKAEFGCDCSAADVKDLFRAAAEVEPHHVLKMYNWRGSVVNISPRLEANTPDSCYRLEAVASDLHSVPMPPELDSMEHRLNHLETKVIEDVGKTPDAIFELKSQVESFKRKLESVKHLSWMGLFKGDGNQHLPKTPLKARTPQLSVQEEHQRVRMKFLNMSSLQVTGEVRELLKTPIFDNWQWEEAEMLVLLQVMYTDLDFLTAFHIELEVLQNFLFQVYCHYNNIPFHNFQHCFCVTQMMYGLIWLTDLRNKLGRVELLIMLTSALCHDLDHPGYNNVYQINAQTDLALRYNDISPLENHHCAVAFGILSKVHPGHGHGPTQRDPQQVQSPAARVRLHQQGAQGSADEDHGEGERHLQRGQAHGGGRALAGLSAAGVLQPERLGETQRPPSDSLHGPGQSVQTVLSDQLHPVCPPATVHRAHQALPLSGATHPGAGAQGPGLLL
ncbi:high affinity cGMP-specific 3',5'-cyclic phosphodiesterase 9A-like isoform X3 [Mugil cephalus]|uniref:high affinity cGMP-specific 3',5'-cyclic phosphodiesterase 9A-like isoform X3 n=1 Tax=Mugil cephalus TaxID=48193 RepID=UPI001FB63D42|nr:high affinity cGMP-specific 3',5'-cyclic phosphodiesterase 9A-like isoform X3 [Mugil cephalus]